MEYRFRIPSPVVPVLQAARRSASPWFDSGQNAAPTTWEPVIQTSFAGRPSPARALRVSASAASLASLVACAGLPAGDEPAVEELRRNSLQVAAAALAAGQPDAARRLYLSLAQRFENAPEPALGLGYVALGEGDFSGAEERFLRAADWAQGTPAMVAEALLAAGRAALAQGRTNTARRHFERAREPARGTPFAAWIANGLAVTAALDAEHETAAAHYAEALRLSSGHPRIAANFVRLLIAAGRIDEAARAYTAHPPAYWTEGDGRTLSRLIEEARWAAPAPAARDGAPGRSGTLPSPRKQAG